MFECFDFSRRVLNEIDGDHHQTLFGGAPRTKSGCSCKTTQYSVTGFGFVGGTKIYNGAIKINVMVHTCLIHLLQLCLCTVFAVTLSGLWI